MSEATASNEFLGNQPNVDAEPDQGKGEDGLSSLLGQIKNKEGAPKYKSVEDALKGLQHAQEHIARLEQEAANRQELMTRVQTMESLLERLGEKPAEDHREQVQPKLREEEVLSILERRETAKVQAANRQAVLEALKSKFGEKANEVLETKARELGVTTRFLGDMAAQSPKAVLDYFKESKPSSAVQGTVNTMGLRPEVKRAEPPKDIGYGASTRELKEFARALRAEVEEELKAEGYL